MDDRAGAGCRRSWRGGRRARRWAGAVGRGRGGQAALLRCLGNSGCSATGGRGTRRGFYSALPRHGSGRGTAAPRSVARQALPRQRSTIPVATMSALCRATMHGAAQAFGRAYCHVGAADG